MDLHHLEYIIEIANMGGISKASENLHITQSTLSQYLIRLEEELGIRLFDRRRDGMVLTAAGQLYVDTCRQILQEKEDLYRQLADLTESKTGSFSVGITPQWGSVAYSHIIGPFRQLYPRINVRIREETAAPLLQLLSDNQIDMAIVPLENNTQLTLKSLLLHTERLLLAIPKSHAAKLPLLYGEKGLPSIDISALAEEPMIFSSVRTTIRNLENRCFASRRITPNIIAEINNHPASLNMVEQQLGSTFVPVSCTAPSEHIVYAYSVPMIQWYIVIAFRRGFEPRQSEKYFIRLAKEYFDRIPE